MKIKTAAKINLSLDVTGKLPNGYHTIESVFQTVGIYDEVTVELMKSDTTTTCVVPEKFSASDEIPCDERNTTYKAARKTIGGIGLGVSCHKQIDQDIPSQVVFCAGSTGGASWHIELTCDVPEKFSASDEIPCNERNIAYKAALKFIEENDLSISCRIHIKKGIPSQAGMGGGSTDAAAVLYCLSQLTGKSFSAPEKLGADVPFFLTGGTAYVEGIGEKITSIADFSEQILVIAKGSEGVSTAEAYNAVDSLVSPDHPDTKSLVSAIENSPETAYKFVGNLFEAAIDLPEVSNIKRIMTSHGALASCMTGSGSAVFGIFQNTETAEKCAEFLEGSGYFAQVCKTVKEAFQPIE